MKRIIKNCFIVALCLVLAGGAGIPSIHVGNTTIESTVETVKAKPKMRKKFKKAMDEYLKFYKKYCKFMKKYEKGGNSLSMLVDYTKLIKQQQKVDKSFKKWKGKKMNSAELAYYAKINSKVLKMTSKL